MAGYLVIGMGRFGRSIAGTLYENKKTVLAIDSDEEIIQQIIDRQIVEEAVVMDTTDENALKKVVNKVLLKKNRNWYLICCQRVFLMNRLQHFLLLLKKNWKSIKKHIRSKSIKSERSALSTMFRLFS